MKKANYSAPKMERVEVEIETGILQVSIPGTANPGKNGTWGGGM